MNIVCLDMEGVLVPEIWIAFAEESGIPELRRTTRDEPDYDKLMRWRIDILRQHGLGLTDIQNTIRRIDPLPGAREFLDRLRTKAQVVILSDTFEQFGLPLMEKLNWPTLLCNTLEVGEDGMISGFRMRCSHSKLTTVRAFQSMGYDTIASGDSYNDLEMIRASKAGFLFRSPDSIKPRTPICRVRGIRRPARRRQAGYGLTAFAVACGIGVFAQVLVGGGAQRRHDVRRSARGDARAQYGLERVRVVAAAGFVAHDLDEAAQGEPHYHHGFAAQTRFIEHGTGRTRYA